MKKSTVFVALALSLTLTTGMKKRRLEPTPDPLPSPVVSVSPKASPSPIASPAPKPTGLVNNIGLTCTSSCTTAERIQLAEAAVVANQIVHGACFEKFMRTWGLVDEWNTPLKADPVIKKLRTTVLTVPVRYYYERSNTVGYRQPPSNQINFNRRFHDYYTVCDTASNATHEWSHADPLSFGHPFDKTSWRGHTVPYAINNAFDACCEDSQGLRGFFQVK